MWCIDFPMTSLWWTVHHHWPSSLHRAVILECRLPGITLSEMVTFCLRTSTICPSLCCVFFIKVVYGKVSVPVFLPSERFVSSLSSILFSNAVHILWFWFFHIVDLVLFFCRFSLEPKQKEVEISAVKVLYLRGLW